MSEAAARRNWRAVASWRDGAGRGLTGSSWFALAAQLGTFWLSARQTRAHLPDGEGTRLSPYRAARAVTGTVPSRRPALGSGEDPQSRSSAGFSQRGAGPGSGAVEVLAVAVIEKRAGAAGAASCDSSAEQVRAVHTRPSAATTAATATGCAASVPLGLQLTVI